MSLTNISPIDGRYKKETTALKHYFSEYAFLRYCVYIEIKYIIALSHEQHIRELKTFSEQDIQSLKNIYKTFSLADAQHIKEIEHTTHHDIKAIEYFLQEKLAEINLKYAISFIHFALTSDDVKNLAYILAWKHAIHQVYIPELENIIISLETKAQTYKHISLLSLTHGQAATPTTLGKEIHVYIYRVSRQLKQLKSHTLYGKLNGATGTWAAHMIAYPDIDWQRFSIKFISSLGLKAELLTTQVNSYDSLAESCHIISRINTIMTDMSRDMWLYISREIFIQKNKDGEIGSSTMPHKINPIYFENAEGNFGIANNYFNHITQTLPISRMQRDLSGSTLIRNMGIPLAHTLIAIKNINKGLDRIKPHTQKINTELGHHWEILTEAIQTILRKYNKEDAYETLKNLSRGKKIDKHILHDFILNINIPLEDKERLLNLTPENYKGIY